MGRVGSPESRHSPIGLEAALPMRFRDSDKALSFAPIRVSIPYEAAGAAHDVDLCQRASTDARSATTRGVTSTCSRNFALGFMRSGVAPR